MELHRGFLDYLRFVRMYFSQRIEVVLGFHYNIQNFIHGIFPGFSGFGFCSKLARTKNQRGIVKASEHNRNAVFFHASKGDVKFI